MDSKAIGMDLQIDKYELQNILEDREFEINVMAKYIYKFLNLSNLQIIFLYSK